MADTAAHLVDRVIPQVPVCQWVLSLPYALRYRLAYDSGMVTEVLRVFLRAVFRDLKRRARECGIEQGAVRRRDVRAEIRIRPQLQRPLPRAGS
jgi:hypothetical protein